jgi:hypothetical protein
MKRQNRTHKNGSPRAALSQVKTTRRLRRPAPGVACDGPAIALIPREPNGEEGSISSEVIDLSRAEFATLKRAAKAQGHSVLMFLSNAALEKAGQRDVAGQNRKNPVAFQHPDGSEFARVDFPREVFERIERARAKSGQTLAEFFNAALQSKLEAAAGSSQPAGQPSISPVSRHGIKSSPAALPEPSFIAGTLTMKLQDNAGNEIGKVSIDDIESGVLQKVASVSGLRLIELFSFIVYRQLEAFYPPGAKGVYCVSDAVREIWDGLAGAERDSDGLYAVCCAMVKRLDKARNVSPADYGTAVTELKGVAAVIEGLANSVRVRITDAHCHWRNSAGPALLEQHVPPASLPLARSAA